ncbi:MAG: HlyC/CorC family transporter [Chlamydiales bacterium]|nr:HlyC/CorC family transporter [Chlamydiia bacterium]MCP5508245.1 HlyC/CorC family transporter [Chlamydiales bacterium]
MSLPALLFLALILLTGMFFLTALSGSLRRIHKRGSQKEFKNMGSLFFYRSFHLRFFPEDEYEGLFFATTCAQAVVRFFFGVCAFALLLKADSAATETNFHHVWLFLQLIGFMILYFVVGDYAPRLFGTQYPVTALRFSVPLASIFLFLAFPLTFLFLKLTRAVAPSVYFDNITEPDTQVKKELIELIEDIEFNDKMDFTDKKIIQSVLKFSQHIAREIMVPRVDVFSLSADTSIREAAQQLEQEGYSRVPVFKDNVDNIVGILMYKDVLSKYMEYTGNGDASILDAPISSIQKPPLYTPETKKISTLLQEFRKKQVHFAVVVDEYGGTEGIVTIEDILEQIVGEIADEYDDEEDEPFFVAQRDGAWIVDARTSLLDTEEQLGIKIPQDSDYDTIGGYIFHCAGEIPGKGFKIEHDDFEIEIISSSERAVGKVRIKPTVVHEAQRDEMEEEAAPSEE